MASFLKFDMGVTILLLELDPVEKYFLAIIV